MKKIPPSRPSGWHPAIEKVNVMTREKGIEALMWKLKCTHDEAVAEWERMENDETQPNYRPRKT